MALDGIEVNSDMATVLERQQAAQIDGGIPSAEKRIDWIDRCIGLLVDHRTEIEEAIAEDFGHRSMDMSRFTETASSIAALKFAKKHLKSWMRVDRRRTEFPFGLLGARSEVQFQPKGVVGIISPWNFPVNLTFTPLAGVIAAGNRAMIKPSEFTEHTSALMKVMFAKAFADDEISVFTGGPNVGAAFSALAFDHLIFTGATSVAKHVMRAAAENLVPLTLELGGKSPVILGASANMKKAANRILAGKTMNAGQICLAPDYAFVPASQVQTFIGHATTAVESMYPSGIKDNDDYTSIVNQRHYDRLMGYLEDASDKGADVIEINPKGEDFAQQPHHKIPPHLVLNPTDEMTVMQEEIFGPILPLITYRSTKDAVDYINANDRPLGLYYFGEDAKERDMVLNNTTSGGVTVNDVMFHIGQEDLPFGGVGPSGMGAYHGEYGFREFSHAKAVYTQTGSEILKMIRPPYRETFRKQIAGRIKR